MSAAIPPLEYTQAPSLASRLMPSRQKLPLLMTFLVCALMYAAASVHYEHFFTWQVLANLLGNNAFLGIAAVGLTFVIIAGGIDLSVGAAIGCISIFIASLVEVHHWNPLLAVGAALLMGLTVGLVQGALITFFELPPFLVTLGGLFFYRGLGLTISNEAITISHPWYTGLSEYVLHIGPAANPYADVSAVTLLFLAVLLIATYVLACRPMGRAVYALGGNEQSALLMGLPVRRIKIAVYAVSGFTAALAGVAATVITTSGNALTGVGLELDAISAVVIGGTLLSGGVGSPIGTLFGVLIFGIIGTAIDFQGNLSSWWGKIVIYLLLLVFILLQTLLQPREDHA